MSHSSAEQPNGCSGKWLHKQKNRRDCENGAVVAHRCAAVKCARSVCHLCSNAGLSDGREPDISQKFCWQHV